jgi:hypothetical protein
MVLSTASRAMILLVSISTGCWIIDQMTPPPSKSQQQE